MKSLKGQLLIASPSLVTPFFSKTVILMLDHTEKGAMGVVINRPIGRTIGAIAEHVFEEPVDWDKPIMLGGPVPGPLMVIHSNPIWADETILSGVFSTVDAPKVRELVRRREEPMLIVANYSGWGPGQLEGEFEEDSWVTLPANEGHVFRRAPDDDLWSTVVKQAGARKLSEFLNLRAIPPDPSLN